MQIHLEKAVDGFIGYMAEQVANIPAGINRWLGFGSLAALKANPALLVEKVKPYLEMVGVVKNGLLDLESAKKFLDGAFSKEPKISYFNFTFTADDANALLSKMQVKEEEVE